MLRFLLRALLRGNAGISRVVMMLIILAVSYFWVQVNGGNQHTGSYQYEQTEPAAGSVRDYTFRNDRLLNDHYEKHGKYMGFSSADSYEAAAARVVNNPRALHKYEKEDGDDVYYLESSNEIVIVSRDGYLRTYFNPSNGIRYYNSK